jgi:hypothetical protein
MQYLKQSTASQSVLIGPFVDDTDGTTAETGLSIANTDVRVSKNGANIAAKNSGGGTHDENGWYQITLDATDTATVGRLQLHCKMTGALMVFAEFQVLEEAIYDALFGASAAGFDANGRVDVGSWLGTAVTTSATTSLPEVDAKSISDNAAAADNVQANIGNLDAPVSAVDTVVDAILLDTAEIGAAGAGLTNINLPDQTMDITGNLSGTVGGIAGTITTLDALDTAQDTQHASSQADIALLNNLSAADVNAQVDIALSDIHLDHLLAADYDPASKPGTSTALLNELVESDGGVSRFTVNALENGPSGSGASASAIADAVWDENIIAAHNAADTAGKIVGDNMDAAVTSRLAPTTAGRTLDVSTGGEAGIDWANVGSPTESVTLSGTTVGTTTANTDMRGTDSAYTGTPPTVGAIADAVWDEAQADHTTGTTFGAIATEVADILADTSTDGVVIASGQTVATATAVGTVTGNVDGSVASVTGAVGSVAAEVSADVTKISGSATAADNLEASALGITVGAVNDGSATTTAFAADGFTEATDDHFNGRIVVFTSGALAGQATDITDYAGGTQTITVTALTEPPSDNDTFVIV